MSVSVSQIGTGRSLDRSIDQSQFPGQFLDQSICVCRYLYKEQHPPTRSHFCRKILVDLFSIPSFHPLNLSRACPRSRGAVRTSRSHREDCLADSRTVARPLDPDTNPRRRIHDAGRAKSRDRESAHEMRRSTMKKAEKVGPERRTMHRRPTWVPRTKLTRYVNCLSNLSPSPPCVYIQIYKYIMHICTYAYMCTCVWYVRALRARRGFS